MESTEKSSAVQEIPPDQVQGFQSMPPTSSLFVPMDNLNHPPTSTPYAPPGNPALPPTSTPYVPPGSQTYPPSSSPYVPQSKLDPPPYPTTTMVDGQTPVMYHTANPATQVITAQPPGTYPNTYSSVPANMTSQQPMYTDRMAPQPQYLHTNFPPYPITSAPGPHHQFNSYVAYPTATVFGSQQQYPVYQDTRTTMVTTQHYSVGGSSPKDYLCWSFLSMIFCICPLGLVAVIFSSKTSSAKAKQDWGAARRYSSLALIFNFLSLMLGVTFYFALIAIQFG